MIHPDLATMLAVLTTDYPLDAARRSSASGRRSRRASTRSPSTASRSTNDAVILLANGASGVARTPRRRAFAAALGEACADLARQVVADGEGITVLAEITVSGAVDDAQARAIARRIATSPLVKTALFGHDANWGRVLMAAGSAPWNGGYAEIDSDRVTLRYNGTVVLDRGTPLGRRARRLRPELHDRARPRPRLRAAGYLTSDLSYDYVRINADYRT